MSTGDLTGNIQRLLRDLRTIKYPADADEVGLRLGDPVALLPLLSFTLLKFSRHVARFIARSGYELAGKTDHRFIEGSFRLLRDILNVRTVLTPAQFLEQGFAERKVLLLCDAIAACKKLHNEEVRQERLAALKASRQQQQPYSGGAPGAATSTRASPVVKVVRAVDNSEVRQVLGAQHLPNATDGAQSVYQAKKSVTTSSSPSPQPSASHGRKTGPRIGPGRPSTASSGGGSHSRSDNLELTFRPVPDTSSQGALGRGGARAGAGQDVAFAARPASALGAAPPGASGTSSGRQQPVHAWFLNPAFDDGVDVDLGLGLDVAHGRPDSSAWWQTARRSPQHAAAGGPRSSAEPARASAAAPSSRGDGQQAEHPRQPRVSADAAPSGRQQPAHAAAHYSPARDTSAAQSSAEPGSEEGEEAYGRGQQPHAAAPAGLPRRELDEWSFSSFFGPGRGPGQKRANEAARGGRPQDMEAEPSDVDGESRGAVGDVGPGAGDQDRYRGGQASVGTLPASAAAGLAPVALRQEARPAQAAKQVGAAAQPEVAAGAVASGVRGGGGATDGGTAALVAQLERLERETQQQLRSMQEGLLAAEQELAKCRLEAQQACDVLQARVTVLEGRVRFLECEIQGCVKHGGGSSPQPGLRADGAAAARTALYAHEREAAGLAASPPLSSGGQQPQVEPPRRPGTADARLAGAGAPAAALAEGGSRASAAFSASRPDEEERSDGVGRGISAYAPGAGLQHQPPQHHANNWGQVPQGGRGPTGQVGWGGQTSVSGVGAAGQPLRGSSERPPPMGLSPMPQPAFSFQPGALMQQVASAHQLQPAQPPPSATSSALGPAAAGPGYAPASRPPGVGGSLDQTASAAGDWYPRAYPAAGALHSSLDGGMTSALHSGVAPASAGGRLAAAAGGERAGREAREALRGSGAGTGAAPLYGRAAAGSSILDSLPAAAGPAAGAGAAQANRDGLVGASATAVAPAPGPAAAAAYAAGAMQHSSTAPMSGPGAMVTPAAGRVAGGGAPGAAPGSGSYRSTDELINSLFSRYTEAQDFLQTLRKR